MTTCPKCGAPTIDYKCVLCSGFNSPTAVKIEPFQEPFEPKPATPESGNGSFMVKSAVFAATLLAVGMLVWLAAG